MRRSAPVLAAFALFGLCQAQDVKTDVPVTPKSAAAPAERNWFPHNAVRGFVDFEVAPPHNELDLALCKVGPGVVATNGACNGFARYVGSGYLEVQPVGRGPLRRLIFIVEPKFFFGDNFPQLRYTASAAPIMAELSLGAAVSLTDRLELRVVTHKAHGLGRYTGANSVWTDRPDGPYGANTTVGARYYFGGYGRTVPGVR